MFDVLKRLAGGGKLPTASELRSARDDIDEAALGRAIEAAVAERRELLLTGDDRAIELAEQQIAKAERDLERARAARELLTERILRAERDEAAAALDAERAAADAAASACASALRREYPAASSKIIAILERLSVTDDRIRRVNEKLAAAGRADELVTYVEERAFPPPDSQHIEATTVQRWTCLRPVPGSPGYGDAIVAFERMGVCR